MPLRINAVYDFDEFLHPVRRDFESRLMTERKLLTAAHEEAVRHHNNEQKQMEEEVNQLKRSLAAAEQNKHLIEQVSWNYVNVCRVTFICRGGFPNWSDDSCALSVYH